ncbi:MAG: radical SAM protein [Candidatus Thorarchaeota archaeon]
MPRDIQLSRGNSPYVGKLTKGCRECIKGAKLVLFVTGKCAKNCYYCPISEERCDQDIIFANELEVKEIQQAIVEAKMINATGMGITGGEPLLELARTITFIRTFKEVFGSGFHVHLYTGLEPVPLDAVKQLLDAGLDELRLHRFRIGKDFKELKKLIKGQGKLGLEIPIIPGMQEQLRNLLRELDELGIDFVNLNEMEFTSGNASQLQKRGFQLDSDTIAAVQNSEQEAIDLLEWAATNTALNIHFCPLSLKDGPQLRNRFMRRARNIAKPFEKISNEGLLVKGIIVPKSEISLTKLQKLLISEYQIKPEHIWVNERKGQLETSTRIVRRLAKQLKKQEFNLGIVEEYPIASRFQVSYCPL